MSDSIDPSQSIAPLRQQAEKTISAGKSQFNDAYTLSADALGVLYRLSSEANTASDALKLLHELKIHQVELELQLEQLQNNERESSLELACYQQFFSMAPIGCFIASLDGIITDSNAAAIRLFEHMTTGQNAPILGRPVLSLFSASCKPMLNATLARVQRNQQQASLIVTPATSSAEQGNFHLTINLSPDHNALLIILAEGAAPLPAQPQLQSSCE